MGPRYLLVVTNVNDNQADPDRTNNFFAVPLTLTSPNLAVSNVSASPASVESGNGQALERQMDRDEHQRGQHQPGLDRRGVPVADGVLRSHDGHFSRRAHRAAPTSLPAAAT